MKQPLRALALIATVLGVEFGGSATGPLAYAQAPAGRAFEVASIKPFDGDMHQVRVQMSPGGRYNAKGVNVRALIQQAFDIRDFQIAGGPSWLASDRWEINAKAEGEEPIGREDLKPMLQALLQDRFKLSFKNETKEGQIYELVQAKGGHKLKQVDAAASQRPMMRVMMGQLNAEGATVAQFIGMISNTVGRPVIDKTDLKGNYNFKLEWAHEPGQHGGAYGGFPAPPPGGGGGGYGGPNHAEHSSSNSGASIFTAVQDQLGLKLESKKGPVPMLVIERIEKPSEN